jgi:hypothetical protein
MPITRALQRGVCRACQRPDAALVGQTGWCQGCYFRLKPRHWVDVQLKLDQRLDTLTERAAQGLPLFAEEEA